MSQALDLDFTFHAPPVQAPRRPRAFRLVRNTQRGPVTVASTDSADVVKAMRLADPALVVEVSETERVLAEIERLTAPCGVIERQVERVRNAEGIEEWASAMSTLKLYVVVYLDGWRGAATEGRSEYLHDVAQDIEAVLNALCEVGR